MKKLLLIIPLFLCACTDVQTKSAPIVSDLDRIEIMLVAPDGAQVPLTVEVALEPQEQAKGLMGRTELPDGTGMLFVFPENRPRSFWMKKTLIPLDIMFFESDGDIVSWASMVPCDKDPCPNTLSAAPAAYALEVPAGFGKKHEVGEGWKLEVETDF